MTRSHTITSACAAATCLALSLGTPVLAGGAGHTSHGACDDAMMRGGIAQLSATHASISTSILIDAAPAQVWATLTNFEDMASWSTGTLQGMTGEIKNGGSVVVTFLFGVDDAGQPISNDIPHKLIFEDGQKIGWSDPFPVELGGGHDNHIYAVEACGGKRCSPSQMRLWITPMR
ncbi:SRPBCC family protein [Shimia sp.]|uniref:SRPBCC family protein n=1 Tax=Shimia sp. TaxID=1954381 RepID=UPI003BACEE03